MFCKAQSFNSELSLWDVSQSNDFEAMFLGAGAFKQELCWNMKSENIITTNMFNGTSRGTTLEPYPDCIS